ncbi:MAG: DUF599 family protein [Gammaproteobacteria bacterium]|nr:DUF599 family protein [Gammaproteobacteria bacterium]
MPTDFTLIHGLAILLIILCWTTYPLLIKLIGIGPLNSVLMIARRRWVHEMSNRSGNPFDAIMIGHLVNSVAFFGSATMIVLAGLFSIALNLQSIYEAVSTISLIGQHSLELFVMIYALLAGVITICFFSFTYALRKLLYSIALIGALPNKPEISPAFDELIEDTTVVLTESLKTFNFGIRGYYYAIATLFLFISPLACILATLIITSILIYRQVATKTSRAIHRYVEKNIT